MNNEEIQSNTLKHNKKKFILLIVLVVVCTGMLIYLLAFNIYAIASYNKQIAHWKSSPTSNIEDEQFISKVIKNCQTGIAQFSFAMVFSIGI